MLGTILVCDDEKRIEAVSFPSRHRCLSLRLFRRRRNILPRGIPVGLFFRPRFSIDWLSARIRIFRAESPETSLTGIPPPPPPSPPLVFPSLRRNIPKVPETVRSEKRITCTRYSLSVRLDVSNKYDKSHFQCVFCDVRLIKSVFQFHTMHLIRDENKFSMQTAV